MSEVSSSIYFDQIGRLKTVVSKLERCLCDDSHNLQYALDRMSAAAELANEDWVLEQKMLAAGIGPHINAGRKVLERIRQTR